LRHSNGEDPGEDKYERSQEIEWLRKSRSGSLAKVNRAAKEGRALHQKLVAFLNQMTQGAFVKKNAHNGVENQVCARRALARAFTSVFRKVG